MNALVVFPGYFLWHYSAAFKSIWRIWMNFLWFVNNLFSITLLLRTLFAPWRRIQEEGEVGFNPERWAEKLIANTMSRFIGACIRLPVIILGASGLLATIIGGVCFYVIWVLAPVIITGLLLVGLYNLI